MRLFLTILFILNSLIGFASLNLRGQTDTNQTFSITKSSLKDYVKAVKTYKDQLIQDTVMFKKENGILELPLIQPHYPPSVIFTDTLIEDEEAFEGREYNYLGQYKKIGFFLVEGRFYEHYECYLIDKRIGIVTIIWDKPKLSPSSKYFANISKLQIFDGVPSGIQIWKIDTSHNVELSKYLELDQRIWFPIDFVWETDNSLILKVVSINKFWESEELTNEDYYYLRINL